MVAKSSIRRVGDMERDENLTRRELYETRGCRRNVGMVRETRFVSVPTGSKADWCTAPSTLCGPERTSGASEMKIRYIS